MTGVLGSPPSTAGTNGQSIADLLSQLQDAKPSNRQKAIETLGRRQAAEAVPDLAKELRPYLIHLLGHIRSATAVDFLSTAWKDEETPKSRLAAAAALNAIQGPKKTGTLVEALAKSPDPDVRKRIAGYLGKSGDSSGISPLVSAMVSDASAGVREAAASGVRQFGDADKSRRVLLEVLKTGQQTRGQLQAVMVVQAIAGDGLQDRQAFTDFLITQAPGADQRMTGVLAELIIAGSGGSVEQAGMRLNVIGGTDEKYRPLRIEVGGALALNPILSALVENLQKNFTVPIAKLNKRTQKDWRRTIKSAHRGFLARMWMSIVVFAVGMVILVVSAYQFLFGDVSGDRLWGTGVTFAGGLGAMLAVIYAGPLRDIRRSVSDLGSASAAFIGFIHRVLQTSHTYSFFYLKSNITFEQTQQASELISHALGDMRLSFEAGAKSASGPEPKPPKDSDATSKSSK